MKTKFAIGCLVQWYELAIIQSAADCLQAAIQDYDGDVIVDVVVSMNRDLEKTNLSESDFWKLEAQIYDIFKNSLGINNYQIRSIESLYTIADYRREFNTKFCDIADVLIWGESDMLFPRQGFRVLDSLHQQVSNQTPKYLATFGICKMWDDSWKPLEHEDFTDKPFIDGDIDNWWSLRYTMTQQEMDDINNKVEELHVSVISPHKFNGCGLIISSEVIKAGVNIPSSIFFVHEDTAFMLMTQKVLGNIPQYHFNNILIVHNRKHPDKRKNILGEESINKTDTGALRNAHKWYTLANKACEQNCYNLFNPNYKSLTWKDIL